MSDSPDSQDSEGLEAAGGDASPFPRTALFLSPAFSDAMLEATEQLRASVVQKSFSFSPSEVNTKEDPPTPSMQRKSAVYGSIGLKEGQSWKKGVLGRRSSLEGHHEEIYGAVEEETFGSGAEGAVVDFPSISKDSIEVGPGRNKTFRQSSRDGEKNVLRDADLQKKRNIEGGRTSSPLREASWSKSWWGSKGSSKTSKENDFENAQAKEMSQSRHGSGWLRLGMGRSSKRGSLEASTSATAQARMPNLAGSQCSDITTVSMHSKGRSLKLQPSHGGNMETRKVNASSAPASRQCTPPRVLPGGNYRQNNNKASTTQNSPSQTIPRRYLDDLETTNGRVTSTSIGGTQGIAQQLGKLKLNQTDQPLNVEQVKPAEPEKEGLQPVRCRADRTQTSQKDVEQQFKDRDDEEAGVEDWADEPQLSPTVRGTPVLAGDVQPVLQLSPREAEESASGGLVFGIPVFNPQVSGQAEEEKPLLLQHGSLVALEAQDKRLAAIKVDGRWVLGCPSESAWGATESTDVSCHGLGRLPVDCLFVLLCAGNGRVGLRSIAAEGRTLRIDPDSDEESFSSWVFQEAEMFLALPQERGKPGGWIPREKGLLEGPALLVSVLCPTRSLRVSVWGMVTKSLSAWRHIEGQAVATPILRHQVQQLREKLHTLEDERKQGRLMHQEDAVIEMEAQVAHLKGQFEEAQAAVAKPCGTSRRSAVMPLTWKSRAESGTKANGALEHRLTTAKDEAEELGEKLQLLEAANAQTLIFAPTSQLASGRKAAGREHLSMKDESNSKLEKAEAPSHGSGEGQSVHANNQHLNTRRLKDNEGTAARIVQQRESEDDSYGSSAARVGGNARPKRQPWSQLRQLTVPDETEEGSDGDEPPKKVNDNGLASQNGRADEKSLVADSRKGITARTTVNQANRFGWTGGGPEKKTATERNTKEKQGTLGGAQSTDKQMDGRKLSPVEANTQRRVYRGKVYPSLTSAAPAEKPLARAHATDEDAGKAFTPKRSASPSIRGVSPLNKKKAIEAENVMLRPDLRIMYNQTRPALAKISPAKENGGRRKPDLTTKDPMKGVPSHAVYGSEALLEAKRAPARAVDPSLSLRHRVSALKDRVSALKEGGGRALDNSPGVLDTKAKNSSTQFPVAVAAQNPTRRMNTHHV